MKRPAASSQLVMKRQMKRPAAMKRPAVSPVPPARTVVGYSHVAVMKRPSSGSGQAQIAMQAQANEQYGDSIKDMLPPHVYAQIDWTKPVVVRATGWAHQKRMKAAEQMEEERRRCKYLLIVDRNSAETYLYRFLFPPKLMLCYSKPYILSSFFWSPSYHAIMVA